MDERLLPKLWHYARLSAPIVHSEMLGPWLLA